MVELLKRLETIEGNFVTALTVELFSDFSGGIYIQHYDENIELCSFSSYGELEKLIDFLEKISEVVTFDALLLFKNAKDS